MKKIIILLFILVPLFANATAFAIETASRISDREIIEGLTTIRGDINELRANIRGEVNELRATIHSDVTELRTEIKRLDEGQKALEKRFDGRFDVLQWMLGLFITVAISLMGIMGRILWSHQKKLTQIETFLEAQKEEIAFIKILIVKLQSFIEKFFPPKGVL
ncbi:MAG: hypothetical protein HW390_104 [Candidatus Brocadiaceae bacterium]|nr:hypothetical protein [Candidatus Brocadiaceae bacterium]